jgi:hypothetical protein
MDIGRVGVVVKVIEGISHIVGNPNSLLPSKNSVYVVRVKPISERAIVGVLINKVSVALM